MISPSLGPGKNLNKVSQKVSSFQQGEKLIGFVALSAFFIKEKEKVK